MAYILGIESSCDETSAAILQDGKILSNLIANQDIHSKYGGVVPELASRAHQQNIVPVVEEALKKAQIQKNQIDAIAYTRGPGLLGSLLVGSSFVKGLSLGLDIPLIEVNHMQAHILAHFIDDNASTPQFPFLCLTVSGGHTQIIKLDSPTEMEILGETLDDAAGEAFDKAAKMMGIEYPGGPLIDRFAKTGDPKKFHFKVGKMDAYNFSFSGLKTGILYFLRDNIKTNPNFIAENKADLCASIQNAIVTALMHKVEKAAEDYQIKDIAIAGGVSANSELRRRFHEKSDIWNVHIPKFEYCTDNAAMIAMAGYFKYLDKDFGKLNAAPLARMKF